MMRWFGSVLQLLGATAVVVAVVVLYGVGYGLLVGGGGLIGVGYLLDREA